MGFHHTSIPTSDDFVQMGSGFEIAPGRLLVRISPEIAQKRSVFAKQHFYEFFGFKNNQIQRVPHPLSINPSTTKHSLMYQMYECCPKKAFRHQTDCKVFEIKNPQKTTGDSVLGGHPC